jgi:predicted 3-demethylubiquinone-9 3-methyltransferase (glyoxalase superfamily)
MATGHMMSVCLWFNGQAEEAARYYTGIFRDSRMGKIAHFGQAGREIHGQAPGSVLTVEFELNGCLFTALNGGPDFKFNEAISLTVHCADQSEIDYYWDRLAAGGDPAAQQCGWLKDRYGVSWQIVPAVLSAMIAGPVTEKTERVLAALLTMKKLDLSALKQAQKG